MVCIYFIFLFSTLSFYSYIQFRCLMIQIQLEPLPSFFLKGYLPLMQWKLGVKQGSVYFTPYPNCSPSVFPQLTLVIPSFFFFNFFEAAADYCQVFFEPSTLDRMLFGLHVWQQKYKSLAGPPFSRVPSHRVVRSISYFIKRLSRNELLVFGID